MRSSVLRRAETPTPRSPARPLCRSRHFPLSSSCDRSPSREEPLIERSGCLTSASARAASHLPARWYHGRTAQGSLPRRGPHCGFSAADGRVLRGFRPGAAVCSPRRPPAQARPDRFAPLRPLARPGGVPLDFRWLASDPVKTKSLRRNVDTGKITMVNIVTLDGVMQAPASPLQSRPDPIATSARRGSRRCACLRRLPGRLARRCGPEGRSTGPCQGP